MRMRPYVFSVLLAALAVASPARAQESAWATRDAETVRFPDADTAGPKLEEGDEVTVLFREGDLVRVRKGDRYGWVEASVLTDTAPEGAEPAATPPSTPPGEFDMQKLRDLLQRTQDL